jgi:hypothetical protein
MLVGLPFSAPPHFIFKTQGNIRVVFSQSN